MMMLAAAAAVVAISSPFAKLQTAVTRERFLVEALAVGRWLAGTEGELLLWRANLWSAMGTPSFVHAAQLVRPRTEKDRYIFPSKVASTRFLKNQGSTARAQRKN